MLRKVYPGEQVKCNNSSQHKIDHKIKGLNNDNRKIQKEEENITQGDRKREMKQRNLTLKFMSATGMMTSMDQSRRTLKLKTEKFRITY